jgi:hypothetical protein
MIVLTFLDFPNLDKVHRSSTIDNLFMAFVNVYPSCILSMLMGINYLLKNCANNSRKPTPPSVNANGVSTLDDYCNCLATLPA